MSEAAWVRWYDKRPEDIKAKYRWRVSKRPILGLEMQPEWADKLQLFGMGGAAAEWWPISSSWDGYNRRVDDTLEWRPAAEGEVDTTWNGLDLLPSPWTGKPPKVVVLPSYISAPPYALDWIGIVAPPFVKSLGWIDAAVMMKAWNTRVLATVMAPTGVT